jgi:hypothetical protein
MSTPGSLVLQLNETEYGLLAAKMFNPLLPLKLNLTGIALPAFTEFNVGKLLTGEKNPVKLYSTVTVKLHDVLRFAPSLTVNVLVVVPKGNEEPLGRPVVCVVVAPLQLSDPVGAV